MLFGDEPRRKPRCLPLDNRGPPGPTPCKPTLLLGLSDWTVQSLDYVLLNDLAFSSNRPVATPTPPVAAAAAVSLSLLFWSIPSELHLSIFSFLDATSLLHCTKAFGVGSVIVSDRDVRSFMTTGDRNHHDAEYQAIVVDDSCFFRDPDIARFVTEQYRDKDTSVVIMGVEGIFNLEPLRLAFGVNWETSAYTSRTVKLNDAGRKIIGREGFAMDHQYVKALFVEGEQELFLEHVDPRDYEDDSSDGGDPVPAPQPGSPVVTCCEGDRKSVSYFGFVNDLDVSFGAIILRLCYAAQHRKLSS